MGYIDSDTHVVECAHTWDFFDPDEQEYKPSLSNRHLRMQEVLEEWPDGHVERWMTEVFPPGAVDLSEPAARLRYMDELGVDVHVLFPTFWLVVRVGSAVAEAAMSRSYNRWLAERTSDSGGRLRWAVHVPVRTMDRALQEMEFGRDNGAVSVFLPGIAHGMSVRDPYLLPIFHKAQDLDLAVSVHIAGDFRNARHDPGKFLFNQIMPVPCALNAVLESDLCERFPRLRWSFLEAGASWIPFVVQEAFRFKDIRGFGNGGWQSAAREAFSKHELYVSCLMDDDLAYLSQLVGYERLVHGTDFGHLDIGSDPNGLHVIASRSDLDPVLTKNIVDTVARRLYGIDESFCPAPPPTVAGYAISPLDPTLRRVAG